MEELHTYIERARAAGQTDEQIRQALVLGGWNAQQVKAALQALPAVQTRPMFSPAANVMQVSAASPQSPLIVGGRKPAKVLLIIIVLLIVIAILAGSVYSLFLRKTSYQAVIQQFVTAIQDKNQAAADALESPASKAAGQKIAGTQSFYTDCQQVGQSCTQLFSASYLTKATKTYTDYTAKNGTKGKQITYTIKQTVNSSQASAQAGCTITTNLTTP
jgi:hypothetical protein